MADDKTVEFALILFALRELAGNPDKELRAAFDGRNIPNRIEENAARYARDSHFRLRGTFRPCYHAQRRARTYQQ